MANIKFLRKIFNEIRNDFCSLRYLSNCTFISKNYIWNQMRLMKALGIVEEKFSTDRTNVRVYKLKDEYSCDFEKFLEAFTEKL